MNRDLGVWTNEDCALVLIDYQPEQLEAIRSEQEISPAVEKGLSEFLDGFVKTFA